MTTPSRNSDRSSRNSAKNNARLSRKAAKRVLESSKATTRRGASAAGNRNDPSAERTRDYVKQMETIESPRNEERHKRTKHRKNQ